MRTIAGLIVGRISTNSRTAVFHQRKDEYIVKIAEFMKRDHDRLDGIFQAFREARTDHLRARSLFNDLAAGLKRHIAWEEEILFELFKNKTGMHNGGPTEVLRIEHREIEMLLQNILKSITEETGDMENMLLAVLSRHNHKEELILYPWMDSFLDEKEKEDAFRRMV